MSAAGVVYKAGKVLLIRSERRGWEFPGGIVEQGEALLDGLRREIFEESGISVEPEAVTGIYQNLAFKKGYGPLEGMTLVVSGVFEHFSRDEIKSDIERHGGKVSGSISSKTTYLVAGDKMGPEKRKKAENLGVQILTEEEYMEIAKGER